MIKLAEIVAYAEEELHRLQAATTMQKVGG